MPTIRNDGSAWHLINDSPAEPPRFVPFPPGATLITYDHAAVALPGVTLVSAAPYWNPVIANDAVSFAVAGSVEVVINVAGKPVQALIWQVSGCNVSVYLDSPANVPKWATLRPGDLTGIPLRGRVGKLFLVSDGPGSCSVVQSTEELEV